MLKKIIYFLPLLWIVSCTGLDEMSSNTGIVSFTIDSVYTASAQLGTPIINDSSATIEIPLDYGQYLPSIVFDASIVPNSKVRKVLGMETGQLVFTADAHNNFPLDTFHVMAENGFVCEWYVKLKQTPRSEDNAIVDFNIKSWKPDTSIIAPTAFIFDDGERNFVRVLAPEANYPFDVTVSAHVSEGAMFVNMPEDNTFTFENKMDVHSLIVRAASGKEATWLVIPEMGDYVYDDSMYESWQLQSVNIDESTLLVTSDNEQNQANIKQYYVDVEQSEIVIELKDTMASQFPFSVNLEFPLQPNMRLLNYEMGAAMTYSNPNELPYFYLMDQVSGLKKRWKVRLKAWKNTEAEVIDMQISRIFPGEIEIDSDIEIDAARSSIVMYITEGQDLFPMTIRANFELSDKAHLQGIESGKDIVFDTIDSKHVFQVVAEDGTVKEWTLSCLFSGTLNTEADVESFVVTDYTSTDNKVELINEAAIDAASNTVTITITNWAKNFPLRLKASMLVSRKATMVEGEFDEDDWLEFSDTTATRTFKLRSQDGLKEKDWTVKFDVKESEKNADATLISFRPMGVSSGYDLIGTNINQDTKTVTLSFLAKGSGLLEFRTQVEVSPGAQLVGLSNGMLLKFNSFSEVKTFNITSESGSVTNEWKIKASFEPQLENSDFERWAGLNFVGWGSANMSGVISVSTTSQVDGPTGYCVKMVTGKTSGKIAAGSCFLGYFKFTSLSDALNNPKKMTYFGIPFTARPTSITFDYNYDNKGSDDTGSVQLDMINYEGDDFEYHTIGNEPGVTIINSAFREPLTNTNGWKTITIPISYVKSLPSTHIHLAFSSSFRGDEFIGTVGATLFVDNVKLGYE